MMSRLLCAGVACWVTASVLAEGFVIFDNGGPDGSNGISCGDFDFGYREVADDFVLDPWAPHYLIYGAEFSYLWYSGHGLGCIAQVQVNFYEDDGAGKPVMDLFHSVIARVTYQWYTGDWYFGRPEVRYYCDFDFTLVPSGTPFWVSFTPWDAPENGFWLTSAAAFQDRILQKKSQIST